MNVAGKRVAPAEIESVLATDPAVAECAVVGIPDPTKGESVWAFWVRRSAAAAMTGRGDPAHQSGGRRARQAVRAARVIRVEQLPKTRSAKILRRAVRAAVLDADPGDLSGAENPEAVERSASR